MSKKEIYICMDSAFDSVYGMPCTIVKRKSGVGQGYVTIRELLSEREYLTFPIHIKKAPNALDRVLRRSMEIYELHSKLRYIGEG